MMADDDPDDREFLKDAFEECGFEGEFLVVEDGAELLAYLQRRGGEGTETCPAPDLVLLDLNMPKVDGYEALKVIKSDQNLCHIPVVVVTTSQSEEDVRKTYQLGVNSFVTKPPQFEDLVKMAAGLKEYWLETVRLPEAR
ncbi:MAG: response regulator [Verrucomicrobiota bacterium]